jgi:predicted ABC-type ATPase
MQHPNLYIIAGPNGAGKTTASFNLLPDVLHCPNFVNADEIARGLSPFAPETVAFQAGRIMLQRIDELLPQKVDFAIETTLATRSYVQLVRRAQALGYKVHLIFFFLENEEQAIQRVAQRVSNGGHNIPEEDIRRRFKRGIYNLIHLYMPICDSVLVYNNVKTPAQLVARKKNQVDEVELIETEMWNQLMLKL